jgi:large subunit ribosomal protein L35
MPKMKTNRSAKKRFRATGTGRIRRPKAGKAHKMSGKRGNRLRRVEKNDMVSRADEKRIARIIPYEF